MRGVVYLVNGDQLVAMERSLYDAEDILQGLRAADARLLGVPRAARHQRAVGF